MRVPFDKDMVAEVLHGMRITNVVMPPSVRL